MTAQGPIKLQFAFQGGGARLAPLLAAAHGAYLAVERDSAKKVQITNIAGTSAGAIVAAILASGKNPEIFRTKFSTLGRKYLPKIAIKAKGKWTLDFVYKLSIIKRIFAGDTLYDSDAYRNFLLELFTDPENQNGDLIDFDTGPSLFFPTSNLYLQKSMHRKFDPASERIDHALFKSSALPIVFHTHKNDDGEIDGGLLNNFPIDCLQPATEFGRHIGITFRKEAARAPKSLPEYLLLLVSCVTESKVQESAGLVADRGLIAIDTTLDLLDFDAALDFVGTEKKAGDNYAAVRDFVKERVSTIIAEEELKRQISSTISPCTSLETELTIWKDKYARDINNLVTNIQAAHSYVYKATKIRLTRRVIEYRCYNLLDKTVNRKDLCKITDYVCAVGGPIYAYGTTITSGPDAVNPGTPEFFILNPDGQRQNAVAIVIPESYSGRIDSNYSNLMLFLENPIPVSASPFQITTMCQTEQALYDLLFIDKHNEDIICTTCETAEAIDELFIVCEIPKALKNKVALQSYRPDGFDNFSWVDGIPMETPDFVKLHLNMVDPDFARIGWLAQNLTRQSGTGFKAMARDKTN